jgi:hypothetical protein
VKATHYAVELPDPLPDTAIGQNWAVKQLKAGDVLAAYEGREIPQGSWHECVLLETGGPAYLSPAACKHLAGLLLAYADTYEREINAGTADSQQQQQPVV